ncbi:conserved hypothetical protein [Leishmania mexicana MHOM/GT/2001/U1103]|uniref:RING-type domain-containing protein n=1 Tax=Leishmania mexicana (strain MHOM/GT/2001/U1103) TaxID=929439 RepID=E9B288_LEIMU|nr:conserved hypothetical protein [Leishmania mexicana MHOM/GT/2001/U1103]CBZ29349.1 conserved hypothetical protein [Leishmania mexicana MHOM/GT/2001/U1103]
MTDGVWRSFRFFDSEALAAAASLAELNVVCTCLTPTSLVVGDCEGQVLFLERHPASTATSPRGRWCFQAYAGPVTHIRYCAVRNTLITIGSDDAVHNTILRVWDLDQLVALYRGLVGLDPADVSTSIPGASAADAPLRWRPPCQEHRILPVNKGASGGASSAHATGDEAPLVTILLDESKQLQCHFKPFSTDAGMLSPFPTGNSTGKGLSPRAGEAGSTDVVSCGSIRSPVVGFDVAPDLSCAAVGLVTRDCVVLQGDLAKERSVRVLTIRSGLAKGALTFVGLPSTQFVTLWETKGSGHATDTSGGSASAFSFLTDSARALTRSVNASMVNCSAGAAAAAGVQVLYTVYEDVVTCWALRANGNWSEYPCPAPSGGAPRFGAALTSHGELLVLCRQPASHVTTGSRVVRFGPANPVSSAPVPYDPTMKSCVHPIHVDHVPGRCFLYTHRQYLVLLVQHDGRPEQFQLQCFDLAYRIRGLSRPQETYTNCAMVLADGTDMLVLFLDPAVRTRQLALRGVRLREADTQTKLELLFSKECYGIAQQLAQTMEGADPTLQLRIRKRYGDYLYGKHKFDEAMAQYVGTIGHLESSYVIQRYMGSAHMEQLIRYLEELHNEKHGAHTNMAHTTLLLKCYIKRKDETRLKAFIHRDDVRFDAKNAIEVCREGGYAAAALYIADRYAAVYDCARIRLYDMQEPLETLSYVRTLGIDEAEPICSQLGKDLLLAAPRATTELLIELCVHWKGPGRRLVDGPALPTPAPDTTLFPACTGDAIGGGPRHPHHANACAFLHIFVDAPVCLMNFLRAVVESGVLNEDAAAPAPMQMTVEGNAATPSPPAPPSPTVTPSPHTVLYNTLLELYMTRELKSTLRLVPQASAATAGGVLSADATTEFPLEPYERRLEQARTFLEAYKGRYDHYLALTLAHQHRFEDGILYLLRLLGLSEEILDYYGAKLNDPNSTPAERREATAKLFQACQERPAADSSTTTMWMTLLSQLMRTATTESLDIVKVLDYIEAHDALSPVVVLEILRKCPESTLDLRTVRNYCQRCLLKQTQQLQEVLAQTSQRLGEMERIKKEVVALQTSAVVFQATTCAHCHQALDTPTVYFMCKHAFHHRCLYTAAECNVCAAAHRSQLDAIREEEQRDLQLQNPSSFAAHFFQDMKCGRDAAEEVASARTGPNGNTPQDGFRVVTDYVARGVLGAPPPYKDAGPFGCQPPTVPLHPGGSHQRVAAEVVGADNLDIW